MPVIKIARRNIAAINATDKPVVYFDDTLKGFGLLVRPSGSRSWILEYRPGAGGRGIAKKRIVLGSPDAVTPEQARAMAKDMLAKVRLGADPAAERAEARAADTVAEIADEWLTRHVEPKRKPSTAKLYRAVLDTHILPAIGTRKAATLTRSEVAKLHSAIARKTTSAKKEGAKRTASKKTRGGPIIANRALAVLKAMFSWAIDLALLPEGTSNPATSIEAFKEKGRERFLSSEEMQRLGDALARAETQGLPWQVKAVGSSLKYLPAPEKRMAQFDAHSVAAVRLLLLTGARVREILDLEWQHVDFDRGMLRLPDSKTGAKVIVLGAAALSVLDAIPRIGRFVIASTSAGTAHEKPKADVNRLWRAVRREAGIEGTRLHDLRHSNAAVGAGAGLSLHQIGGLLGHSQASTTKRYAHLATDPQRRAADMIGVEISAALGLGSSVLPFKFGSKVTRS
ncbi:tyrosine-type recombinase/integrase [Roseobacter sp. YSTF-M11]|uniref:Tyrosine-type recombinase/integrase n=1 Tax=Roseobacter insulae TaxID=2859783 RepID=A0A9X1FUP5_9RHOB|nr:site-specific integrase [Roseobacter insulae]MBW4708114.1 tyrosine-type recombinase/integrase [Roseobacter insulae]